MSEELQPDESHVQREGGVVGEPCGIRKSTAEDFRAQFFDPVAKHTPRIEQRVKVSNHGGEIRKPQDEDDPEERDAEIAKGIRCAEKSGQYRQ